MDNFFDNLKKDKQEAEASKKKNTLKDAPESLSSRIKKERGWLNISFNKEGFIKNIKSYKNTLILLWSWILLLYVFYSFYESNVPLKIKNTYIAKKNIEILKKNIKAQESEMKTLDNLNWNSQELEEKERIVKNNLYMYDKNLYIKQINLIYEIANQSWLQVDSISKVENPRNDDQVEKFNQILEEKGLSDIENFLEKSWFVNYAINTKSDEYAILRFKEKLEDVVQFVFDGFSISRSDDKLSYSFSIKWFYSLNENK